MNYYEISNKYSGHIMGVWEGDTPEDALDEMYDSSGRPPPDLHPLELEARELVVTAKDVSFPDYAEDDHVEAEILVCGREIGSVDLMYVDPHNGEEPQLGMWGPNCYAWASQGVVEWLSNDDHIRREQIRMIVDAVREDVEG